MHPNYSEANQLSILGRDSISLSSCDLTSQILQYSMYVMLISMKIYRPVGVPDLLVGSR